MAAQREGKWFPNTEERSWQVSNRDGGKLLIVKPKTKIFTVRKTKVMKTQQERKSPENNSFIVFYSLSIYLKLSNVHIQCEVSPFPLGLGLAGLPGTAQACVVFYFSC